MTFHIYKIKEKIGSLVFLSYRRLNPWKGIMYSMQRMQDGWNRHRVLAWMVYLNDVEEGGETEFLYQKLRIKPKKNTLLIWA